jgi:uncharacterized damage-inducible protein DinB
MLTITMIQQLVAYNDQANGKVLDAAARLPEAALASRASPSHGSALRLLQHVLRSEAFFLELYGNIPSSLEEEAQQTLPGIRRLWEQVAAQRMAFLKELTLEQMEEKVHFSMRNRDFVLPRWQLLLQSIEHAVHHRGELSIVLTELGQPLPTLDILLYFLEQSGQSWGE